MSLKNHKILVIGGAGYIGSHVALAFKDAGASVSVLDNFSSGLRKNITDGIDLIEGDIQHIGLLADLFSQPWDGVVHLAALKAAGESMEKPEIYSRQNLIGTLNLLEAYAAKKDSKFIFSSTAAVYGDPVTLPMGEDHPTNPVNFYGFTKLAIEGYLEWYHRLRGLRFASLRYFNAAGFDTKGRIKGLETNTQNLVPLVMEVACGQRDHLSVFGDDYDTRDGSGVRDYIHVSDLARGHVAAYQALCQDAPKLIVNLGAGQGYSVLEILKTAREVSGINIPFKIVGRRDGDPPTLLASVGLAKELLGWEAQESDLRSMIQSTWDVYRESYGL